MNNTAENIQSVDKTPKTQTLAPAPVGSRAIAAVIDYLVVISVVIFLARHDFSEIASAAIFFGFSAIYYSLGNSHVTGGKTLGKQLFNLTACRLGRDGKLSLLDIPQSFLRFFCCFGILILTTEVTVFIFRYYEITASPKVLELHMLAVSTYCIANVLRAVLSSEHRSYHDLFSSSVVVRNFDSRDESTFVAAETTIANANLWALVVGAVVGFLMWVSSVSHHAQVERIHSMRYRIESQYDTRILNVQYAPQTLILQILKPEQLTPEQAVEKISTGLVAEKVIDPVFTNSVDVLVVDKNSDWKRYLYNVEDKSLSERDIDSFGGFFNAPIPESERRKP